jgi:hypothetical protein
VLELGLAHPLDRVQASNAERVEALHERERTRKRGQWAT